MYREQLFEYTPDIEEQGEFMDILFEGVRFVEAYDYFRFEREIERSVG